jgi:hypothetical protein
MWGTRSTCVAPTPVEQGTSPAEHVPGRWLRHRETAVQAEFLPTTGFGAAVGRQPGRKGAIVGQNQIVMRPDRRSFNEIA